MRANEVGAGLVVGPTGLAAELLRWLPKETVTLTMIATSKTTQRAAITLGRLYQNMFLMFQPGKRPFSSPQASLLSFRSSSS